MANKIGYIVVAIIIKVGVMLKEGNISFLVNIRVNMDLIKIGVFINEKVGIANSYYFNNFFNYGDDCLDSFNFSFYGCLDTNCYYGCYCCDDYCNYYALEVAILIMKEVIAEYDF